MTSDGIRVQMLGCFAIERNGQKIDDHSNRMRKVWLLLAYLIYHRNSRLTQSHYITLLNTKGDELSDPGSNLKAMFYRVRTMLNQIDGSAGHDLILRREGSYVWNTDIPLELDVEEFEKLCRAGSAAEDEDTRLDLYTQALALYRGDFLPKLSTESWAMPIAAYYHRIYLETANAALAILEARQQWEETAALCEAALNIEPYSEELYQHLMQAKLAVGDRTAVLEITKEKTARLSDGRSVSFSQLIWAAGCREIPMGALPIAGTRPRGIYTAGQMQALVKLFF